MPKDKKATPEWDAVRKGIDDMSKVYDSVVQKDATPEQAAKQTKKAIDTYTESNPDRTVEFVRPYTNKAQEAVLRFRQAEEQEKGLPSLLARTNETRLALQRELGLGTGERPGLSTLFVATGSKKVAKEIGYKLPQELLDGLLTGGLVEKLREHYQQQ